MNTQITITEDNDWEGETFSYILNVDEDTRKKIIEYFNKNKTEEDEENPWSIELDTTYTQEKVKEINKHSKNSYMDRINFYMLKEDIDFNGEDIFYKGNCLKQI